MATRLTSNYRTPAKALTSIVVNAVKRAQQLYFYIEYLLYTCNSGILTLLVIGVFMASVLRTPEQLSQLLRQRRKGLGLTQAELAARIGLSQKRMSALERRPELLSLRQLLDLAALLDIQLTIDCERRAAKTSAPSTTPAKPPKW